MENTSCWYESNQESLSDHNYIFDIYDKTPNVKQTWENSGWQLKKLERKKLQKPVHTLTKEEPIAEIFCKGIANICEKSMQKKTGQEGSCSLLVAKETAIVRRVLLKFKIYTRN